MSTKEFFPNYIKRHSIFVDIRKFVDEFNTEHLFNNEMLSDACDIIFHFINENVTLLSIKTKNTETYRLTYALAIIYLVKYFYNNRIDIYTDDNVESFTFLKKLITNFHISEEVFFTYVRILPMESVLTENVLNYSIVDGNDDEFLTYLKVTEWTCGIVIKDI